MLNVLAIFSIMESMNRNMLKENMYYLNTSKEKEVYPIMTLNWGTNIYAVLYNIYQICSKCDVSTEVRALGCAVPLLFLMEISK